MVHRHNPKSTVNIKQDKEFHMLSYEMFKSQFVTVTLSGISEPLFIMKGTGACYLNVRGLARLIDKHHEYVRLYAKQAFEAGTKTGVLEAEILTSQGLRTGKLYDETFILGCIAKYKPELLIAFAQLGLRSWLYEQAGYSKVEVPTKDITDHIDSLLKLRALAKEYHHLFQMCCNKKGFPAHKVHDELTKLVNGNTAEDNRLIQELIGNGFDDESIGINHVLDGRFHFILAHAKKYFSLSQHKTDWKNELVRAYQRAVKEWNRVNA